MKKLSTLQLIFLAVAVLAVGSFIGYKLGYDHGFESAVPIIAEEEPAPAPVPAPQPPKAPSPKGCAPAGCSGQICVDSDKAANIVTTCEFRADYACYRSARCERQRNGECGWTQTPALMACLSNPPPLQ